MVYMVKKIPTSAVTYYSGNMGVGGRVFFIS